jgi:hypothetical protein
MDIARINIETADYMVKAAELEVALANTFPLNLMPQLLEATKIDLAIATKMKEIALIEAESRGMENEAEILLNCAKRRQSIYAEKYKAAIHLTKLDSLKSIEKNVKTLGKLRRNSRRSSKKSSRRTLRRDSRKLCKK